MCGDGGRRVIMGSEAGSVAWRMRAACCYGEGDRHSVGEVVSKVLEDGH